MSSKKTTVGAGSAAIKDDGPEPIHDTPPPPPADPKPCDVKPVPTLAETLEDFDTRPIPNDWLKRVESTTPAHSLYEPTTPHENLLDALSEHCGIQWGIKRPMAEAIVRHFEELGMVQLFTSAVSGPVTIEDANGHAIGKIFAVKRLPPTLKTEPPETPEKQPEENHDEPEDSK